nr:hypothetical protein [Achromobacter aegrifaciens]
MATSMALPPPTASTLAQPCSRATCSAARTWSMAGLGTTPS